MNRCLNRKTIFQVKGLFTFLLIVFLSVLSKQTIAVERDSIPYSGFGHLKLYKPEKAATNVIICISGDGGWNQGIESIALHLKDDHTLLIGVDIRPVFKSMNKSKSSCIYPAADFERMSQFVQKHLGYKSYNVPVLLGYSSGATLVYGLLAQAPQNTFRAGIVLGFCPDFDTKKPLCAGSGKFNSTKRKDGKGFDLSAAKSLSAPFISLQGQNDKVCNYQSTVAFLKNVTGAKVVSLPGVGHGYGTEKNWLSQLLASYKSIVEAQEKGIPVGAERKLELPLHLTLAPKDKNSEYMVVFISGDGGWTGYDQQTVDAFAERGAPIAGIDALKYFWEKKTPTQLASDITKIIEIYSAEWKKEKVVLVGYSFGADVMSFAYNRLPENLKRSVAGIGLLSPSKDTDFEIHVSDLLDFGSDNGFSVPAEINRVEGTKVTCFFGKEEEDLPVKGIITPKTKIIYLEGGHHYTNGFEIIAKSLIP